MNILHHLNPLTWPASWRAFRNRSGPAASRMLVLLVVIVLGSIAAFIALRSGWKIASKRMDAGRNLELEHYLTLGWWWTAQAGIVVGMVGLITARWWGGPCRPSKELEGARMAKWGMQAFFISLLLCVGLAAFFRAPRLSHGLWNDEEYGFRKYAWGAYVAEGKEGALRFEPTSWKEVFFANEHGNNHIWSSAETRLGMLMFNRPNEATPPGFQESAARIFPFVSSLLTVAGVALLGLVLGAPRAGILAAILLALAPWHIRYSTEIRGYSSMLFAVTAALLCMVRALQTSRWRWWLGFAAFQAMFLLCFAGSIYLVASINLAALLVVLSGQDRLVNFSRLCLAGALSLLAFFSIFSPSVPQLLNYLEEMQDKASYPPVSLPWLQDLWSHLTTGVFLHEHETVGSAGTSLEQIGRSMPWAFWGICVVLPIVTLAGAALMARDWRGRFVLGSLVAGAALSILHNSLKGNPLLGWYLLYLLPGFVLALAWPSTLDKKSGLPRIALLIGIGYMLITQLPRELHVKVPRQTLREAVSSIYGQAPAISPGAGPWTATFGTSDRQALSYDPRVRILKQRSDLEALMDAAKAEQHPLYVYYCGRNRALLEDADLVHALEEGAWTEPVVFPAMEQLYTYRVMKFVPENWNP